MMTERTKIEQEALNSLPSRNQGCRKARLITYSARVDVFTALLAAEIGTKAQRATVLRIISQLETKNSSGDKKIGAMLANVKTKYGLKTL